MIELIIGMIGRMLDYQNHRLARPYCRLTWHSSLLLMRPDVNVVGVMVHSHRESEAAAAAAPD